MSGRHADETDAPFSRSRSGTWRISVPFLVGLIATPLGVGGGAVAHSYLTAPAAEPTHHDARTGETVAVHTAQIANNATAINLLREELEAQRKRAEADHEILIELRAGMRTLIKER